MWLWMPFLLCRPHATLALWRVQPLHIKPSPSIQWCPKMRQVMLAQGPLHPSQYSRLIPAVITSHPAPSLSILPLTDPWHQVVTVPNKTFSPPSLLPFWNIFHTHICMWQRNSHLLKILLMLLLPVTGFLSQSCNSSICCGRIVLAAHLHYWKRLVSAEMKIWAVFCRMALQFCNCWQVCMHWEEQEKEKLVRFYCFDLNKKWILL